MPLIADSISWWSSGNFDVVGAHALEHVAEQIEFAIGVGCCGIRLGAREQLRLHQGGRRGGAQQDADNE